MPYPETKKIIAERLEDDYAEVIRRDRESIGSDEEGYYYTNRDSTHYERQLPQFNGESFLEIIRSRLREAEEPIDILDVGCG